MFRIFKHNGQVTDRIDTYADARFIAADVDAAQDVADALGVPVDQVAVEHVEDVPAVSVTIPPAVSAPAPPTTGEMVEAILAILASSRVIPADEKAALAALLA